MKQEQLKKYQSFNAESKQRADKLKAEAVQLEQQRDADKEKYNTLLAEGKDDEALDLLNNIDQANTQIKHIANKINLLSEREQQAKSETVNNVLAEHQEVKKHYQGKISKEETKLEQMKSDYIEQAKKIMELDRQAYQADQQYVRVAEQNGRTKDAIKIGTYHRKQAGKYTIETQDIIKRG